MLPLVVLSLGNLLCAKGASATAAPAVTPLAVLPRTESGPGGSPLSAAECPNLQEASFDSSVSDCFSGFVGTKTACQYPDNDAWILHEDDSAQLAQDCICPEFQDIIDQCLRGCPRLFNAAVVQQYSAVCEGGQTLTSPATTSAAPETGTETEAETGAASTPTSGSGTAETAQESGQPSTEPDNAGLTLAMPLSLVVGAALCVAVLV